MTLMFDYRFSAICFKSVILFGAGIIVLQGCVPASLVAADVLPEQQPQSAERSSKPLNDLKELSERVTQAVTKEGISPHTVKQQRKLAELLKTILSDSKGSSSVAGNAEKQQTSRIDPSSQNQSNSSQETPPAQLDRSTSSPGLAGETSTANTPPEHLPTPENLADSVWGHLPPRERNDLLKSYSESYLPGYENQVRDYFERLARLRRQSFKETLME